MLFKQEKREPDRRENGPDWYSGKRNHFDGFMARLASNLVKEKGVYQKLSQRGRGGDIGKAERPEAADSILYVSLFEVKRSGLKTTLATAARMPLHKKYSFLPVSLLTY